MSGFFGSVTNDPIECRRREARDIPPHGTRYRAKPGTVALVYDSDQRRWHPEQIGGRLFKFNSRSIDYHWPRPTHLLFHELNASYAGMLLPLGLLRKCMEEFHRS